MIEITAQPSQRYTPPVDDWESFIQICHEEDFSGLPMLGYRQDYEIAHSNRSEHPHRHIDAFQLRRFD